ncbi:MAG: gamma-glutamyltransferase family protein [Acidimicrobiales bacterium]
MSPRFTTRPELAGTLGMVAATDWLAAQAGMAMLEAGGNAFDAAAAAGFVLEVVEPHQNGLGGEAPMIGYSVTDNEVFVVDGQGPAPASATIQAFEERGLDLVPGTGLLAACVPGAFGSFTLLLERFGTMTLRQVLSPAIGYAAGGFPTLAALSRVLGEIEPVFCENWPTSAELWLGGGVPRPGQRITNVLLAHTYERLIAEAEAAGPDREAQLRAARRAFYDGFVAEAVCNFSQVSKKSAPAPDDCLLTRADMAEWQPSFEAPTRFAYRDFEVFKTGPWGQGPVMLQQLALLAGIDLKQLGEGSPEFAHVVTECAKLAFADREAFYGDPRHVEVPLGDLLSPSYNDERRLLVGDQASLELRPGSPGGRKPHLPSLLNRTASAYETPYPEGGIGDPSGGQARGEHDTCHLDVADRFGNLVSVTPSGGWLQSSPALTGLGFCLGTRAQMFWLEEGLASSLVPRARPRTTLSPSLAFRDGVPYMAFGTPGGDQQDQWPLRVFLYHAEFDLPLQEAIDTAGWHSTHFASSFFPRESRPGEIHVEPALGAEAIAALSARGHRVVEAPSWSLGRVTAVARTPDGLLHGAADARSGQAYVVGR